ALRPRPRRWARGPCAFPKVPFRREPRRRWLKRWLLLALRLGCVVLLAFLFARPFRAEFVGGGDTGLTVLLIDRSASMARQRDGVRLIDHAVRQLPEVVAQIPARSGVEVAWFDMKVEPIGASRDGRLALNTLEVPATLTGGTDFAAALTWAAARCAAAPAAGPLPVPLPPDL